MNFFACSLCKPSTEVFFGLLRTNPYELHVTHVATHGDKANLISGGECIEKVLDRLELAYLKVFLKPIYPFCQNL